MYIIVVIILKNIKKIPDKKSGILYSEIIVIS